MKNLFHSLNTRDTLILQQISEDVEGDVSSLAEELGEPREKIVVRLQALRQKGLVVITRNYEGICVQLSRKGKMMMNYMWPEMGRAY